MLLNRDPPCHHDNHTDNPCHPDDQPDNICHHDNRQDNPRHHADHLDNLYHLDDHSTSALFAAAENGHTDCVKLLLSVGVSADVSDENGFTPLHFAAAHGHHRCVCVLLEGGADVDRASLEGETPLLLASRAGRPECVAALLEAGANRSHTATDSCTALHAAVTSGHVTTLRLLLYHLSPDAIPDSTPSSNSAPPRGPLAVSSALLNQANSDGWTAAHIAAARGFKDCLELLCGHSEQDIERRDCWNRTIHHVATDDCKDLLENLDSYRVCMCLQCGGGGEPPMCPVEGVGEEERGRCSLGTLRVHRATSWAELSEEVGRALTSHLHLLCTETGTHTHPGRDDTDTHMGREDTHMHLGLTPASISSVLIGEMVWLPGQELTPSPWDLVRKPHCQTITIRLKGLSESCLDELALESLIPLHLLQNYIRLVEQYCNVIFHGLEGSCQEYLANQIARCIKYKQEAAGRGCDIIRVEVEEGLTKEQLLESFINCGFLVPVGEVCVSRCVVVLLEGLETVSSLSELLGDLCEALENRGTAYPVNLPHGQTSLHHFRECGFLIGSLSKPRLQSGEIRLQQHFRWVTLRWDAEPLLGLLGRHLRRKLLHKTQGRVLAPQGLLERMVVWVVGVWTQLNACLSRLGAHEALLGPQLFLSCPLVPDNTQPIVKWLARLWNMVVVPRVEEAIVSRVTVKRSSSQRPSPGNQHLSTGQQAVVKAALSILVNKSVLQGCPLPRHEVDRYLLEFRGGSFPMAAISSCKGGAGRKGRDSGMWRRANTSPRKKGGSTPNWSSTGSLREGSLSNSDVRFITNSESKRVLDGETVGLSLCSDEEGDLIKELQTMCSSKSEPDISKIIQVKDEFLAFPGSPSGQSPIKTDLDNSAPRRSHTTSSQPSSPSHTPAVQGKERRSAPRAKSQLPIPSSRGQQSRASSSSITTTTTRTQVPANRNRTAELSSKTRQTIPPSNSYNVNDHSQTSPSNSYNVNDHSQTLPSNSYNVNDHGQPNGEDIWVLHRELHENINNNK